MKAKLLDNVGGEKTYVVVFDKNEEVIAGLTALARGQNLAASHFTGIGGFSDMTLGFFDREKKDYQKIPIHEQVEVLSLDGDITFDAQGDQPKIHAHVVVGKADGTAHGGHILEAQVWPTLEIMLTESPRNLQRKHDPETGLALISL